ncbi:MAG: class II aldolase/adducin family protein, partial [Clostridia bacterium]|nr:class II aldolase/adducin family protein [Clostridia bacterium]
MNINFIHPADQLVMFMQRIYDKGMTTTSGGNLSIMDEDGNIWITPAGVDKGTLNRNDIVCVRADGEVIGMHKPSSELPFHEAVYKMRPDLKAVLHAHPPALVSFSIARKSPSLDLLPSVRKMCPEVQIAVYAVPGSEELGGNIGKCFADGCDIVLLENHGVCIGAANMFKAFQRFETLEYSANLEIL